MTTVGYGDITPKTAEGKVLAIIVMMIGIGFTSLVIGAIAQQFITPKVTKELSVVEAGEMDLLAEIREIAVRLDRIQSHLERRQHSE